MEQLIKIKSEVILFPFLEKYFQKGATFWLGIHDNNVVGHQWSLFGGFNGFYSLPITTKDAIIFATEVYPDYRGHGINPALTEIIFSKLRNDGISHIYLKVHISNEAQLRSLKKTNFERIKNRDSS